MKNNSEREKDRSPSALYDLIKSKVAGAGSSLSLGDGGCIAQVKLEWELCGEIVRKLNTANIRALSHAVAAEYASDMKNNRWGTCYDPVVFTKGGQLNNGQTRLGAAYQAKKDLVAVVVTDGDPDSRLGTDAGRKRTIKMTHNVPTHIASALQVVIGLETGSTRSVTRGAILDRYMVLRDACDHYSSVFSNRKVLREAHLAAAFIFAETGRPKDADLIRELASDLAIGAQSQQASVLIASHVVNRKKAGIGLNSQADRKSEARMFLRAIQAHLLGVDLPAMVDHPGIVEWFTL